MLLAARDLQRLGWRHVTQTDSGDGASWCLGCRLGDRAQNTGWLDCCLCDFTHHARWLGLAQALGRRLQRPRSEVARDRHDARQRACAAKDGREIVALLPVLDSLVNTNVLTDSRDEVDARNYC